MAVSPANAPPGSPLSRSRQFLEERAEAVRQRRAEDRALEERGRLRSDRPTRREREEEAAERARARRARAELGRNLDVRA
jgi:hypothetical protein